MAEQYDELLATCSACVGSTHGLRVQAVDDYHAALELYASLAAMGQTASLCAERDGRYRVCHQPETT